MCASKYVLCVLLCDTPRVACFPEGVCDLFFFLVSKLALIFQAMLRNLNVGCVVAQRNAPPTTQGALAYYFKFIFLHIH